LSDDSWGTEEDRERLLQLDPCVIEAAAAVGGQHEGYEWGMGEATFFPYGPDADALLSALTKCLEGFPIPPGSYAVKRFGPAEDPHASEERIALP